MKHHLYILLLLFQIFPKAGLCQDIPKTSSGTIRFHVDHADFRGTEGKTLTEFYLMLYAEHLKLISNGTAGKAVFKINTRVMDSTENQISQHEWTTEALLTADSTDYGKMVIYDQWKEELSPGAFQLKVSIQDLNSTNKGEMQAVFEIAEMSSEEFMSSQIEFVSYAKPGGQAGPFFKNNRTVIPNPSRRYGVLNPILYLYYELYNLPLIDKSGLKINYSIRALNGEVVKTYPVKKVTKTGNSTGLLHGFDVSAVPSGIYDLLVSVQDSVSEQVISLSRRFEIIQMDYLQKQPAISAEQAEIAGHLLKYITTPDEYKFYNGLGLSGKMQFLIQFWREKDPTPSTLENEFLNEVKQRYQYANEHFGWGEEQGWDTDRGSVLIKYGMPDEIENHHSETESWPYEIWIYHQDRTFIFIFGDLKAKGQFILLHSTREEEIHNPDWHEWIQRM